MPEENSIPGFSDPDRQREPKFGADGKPTDPLAGPISWERSVLEELAAASLKERRLARRWGIFFKSVTLLYATFVLLYLASLAIKGGEADLGTRHTALVTMEGVIDNTGQASAEKVNSALQTAFHDSGTVGVILRISEVLRV